MSGGVPAGELLPVTQADREAAANIASIVRDQAYTSKYVCDGLCEGRDADVERKVEKVARAMVVAKYPALPAWEVDLTWRSWTLEARAAIRAIKDGK